MSDLHNALKSLSPAKWSEVPTDDKELEPYLHDVFSNVHTILESVPIDESSGQPRPQAKQPAGVTVQTSTARSAPAAPEHQALGKEWGKPVKLSAKDNPLGISVYKMSGKDGRGSWFARRSVHSGLGFSQFKKALQQEFPESLAVHGGPGEGKVRGIGAEKRLEQVDVPDRGKVEVLRLTAQFPGPTTPRDFVTLLATSGHRVKAQPSSAPRQYVVVSKPCEHSDVQPTNDFIRGWYESIEYIREVPQKQEGSHSSPQLAGKSHKDDESLLKTTLKKNASDHDLHGSKKEGSSDRTASTKGKSSTSPELDKPGAEEDDSEGMGDDGNPVEWIMVTRSDPGGNVPRFMVERGTPAGIVDDAKKFLEWACQHSDFGNEAGQKLNQHHRPQRTKSFIGYEETPEGDLRRQDTAGSMLSGPDDARMTTAEKYEALNSGAAAQPRNTIMAAAAGLAGTVAGVVSAYTPQVIVNHTPQMILNHLPHAEADPQTDSVAAPSGQHPTATTGNDEIGLSRVSSAGSWASAESRMENDDKMSITSSKSLHEKAAAGEKLNDQEQKVLKYSESKKSLIEKFHLHKEKTAKKHGVENMDNLEEHRQKDEKLAKELRQQEEKHEKELAKIEEKKAKAIQKMKEKRRKEEEKDVKHKLTIERDEARAELELIKKERHLWHHQIAQLQKENAALISRVQKLEHDAGIASTVSAEGAEASTITIPSDMFQSGSSANLTETNSGNMSLLHGLPSSGAATPQASSMKLAKK